MNDSFHALAAYLEDRTVVRRPPDPSSAIKIAGCIADQVREGSRAIRLSCKVVKRYQGLGMCLLRGDKGDAENDGQGPGNPGSAEPTDG